MTKKLGDKLFRGPYLRLSRGVILYLALLTMPLMLAAQCGAAAPVQEAQAPAPTTAKEEVAEPAAPQEAAAESAEIGGQLNFIGWEGYDDPEAFKPFYDQYGVTLNSSYISANDELIAQYKAGGPGVYDVGTLEGRYVALMAQQEMILPLDEAKIPNLKELFPAFKERGEYVYVDGKLYAVPAFLGVAVLCYRADLVPAPKTWDFWKEEPYKGKYGVTQSPSASMGTWALVLGKGQDATKWTVDDLAEMKAYGIEMWKDAATTVTTLGDQKDKLMRGDVVVTTDCWGTVAAEAQKEGVDIRTAIPEGPVRAGVDVYFILNGSKNVETAYAWINHAIAADTMAMLAEKTFTTVTNEKAYALMPDELAEQLGWPDINETIMNTQFQVLPDPEAEPPYVTLDDIYKAFDEVKASIE